MVNRRTSFGAIAGLAISGVVQCARGDEPKKPRAEDPRPGDDLKRNLLRLERDWAGAVVKCDREAVKRFIGDEFMVVDGTGHVWERDSYLDGVASGVGGILSLEIDELRVRAFGDAAVVTARLLYRCGLGRCDLNGAHRFTKTYLRRDGEWRCVAAQEGRIVG